VRDSSRPRTFSARDASGRRCVGRPGRQAGPAAAADPRESGYAAIRHCFRRQADARRHPRRRLLSSSGARRPGECNPDEALARQFDAGRAHGHEARSWGWLLLTQNAVVRDRDRGPGDGARRWARARWIGFRAVELVGQRPALPGRESCLLLCSCSMLQAVVACRRRCRTFTPVGRRGTRAALCGGPADGRGDHRGHAPRSSCPVRQSPQRVDRGAVAGRAADQRGAVAARDRSRGTARLGFGQAWEERSPTPGEFW